MLDYLPAILAAVMYSTANQPPIAVTGIDQSVIEHEIVQL